MQSEQLCWCQSTRKSAREESLDKEDIGRGSFVRFVGLRRGVTKSFFANR